MKILHVNADLGVTGGTELYLARLVEDLGARGHECEIAYERGSAAKMRSPCHALVGLSDMIEPDLAIRERFQAIVAASSPQVIHLHNITNPQIVELAPGLAPTLRQVHDHTAFCPGLNKEYADGRPCRQPMGRHCLERWRGDGCLCLRLRTLGETARRVLQTRRLLRAHRRLDRVLVASAYMREELLQVGIPDHLIVVNPLYTDLAPASEPPTAPNVLMLGRMVHPDKGVVPLLEALAQLPDPFHAQLLGDGPDRSRFETTRDALGLRDRVEFVGPLPHHEALARIETARLVVLPSMWNEPFGIVGIEALAHGRPVIAFDVGGVREWLDPDRNGVLVPRGDTAALATAIAALLRDRERAARLGREGMETVRARFTAEAHLGALQAVYQAIQLRPRPPVL